MTLRITFTYFDGKKQDVVNMHGAATLEVAQERMEAIIKTVEESIQRNQVLTVNADEAKLLFAPGLLSRAHIRFDIVEE